MSALSLLHHFPGPDGWGSSLAVGHPEITGEMVTALRDQVVPHMVGAHRLPTMWHHCDGGAWAAVTDLHRAGRHEAATQLAVLLFWCDQRHNGRDEGCWEVAA